MSVEKFLIFLTLVPSETASCKKVVLSPAFVASANMFFTIVFRICPATG